MESIPKLMLKSEGELVVKKLVSGLLVTLLMVLLAVPAIAAPSECRSRVERLMAAYFGYRERGYVAGKVPAELASLRADLEPMISSSAIMADEQKRQEKIAELAQRVGIDITSARASTDLCEYHEAGDAVTAKVYEWILCNYTENGCADVFGIGTWHDLTFDVRSGKPVLIADSYDEGPLTGMRSQTYTEPADSEAGLSMQAPATGSSSTGLAAALLVAPSYDRNAAVAYSDAWVKHDALGTNYPDYYNYAFRDMNGLGGDCANFTSQAIVAGGLPMVPGSSGWYYSDNGTPDLARALPDYTLDDGWSSAWSNTLSHMNFFSSYAAYGGVLVTNPTAADILKGNPVYMDWDNNGTWNHTVLCVGTNTNGTPIVNSHNKDYWHVVWNWTPGTGYKTVKIGVSAPAPSEPIVVAYPNGGESIPLYSACSITWDPGSIGGNVKIELTVNGGSTWQTITSCTFNGGYYSWSVSGTTTTQAKIRITSLSSPSYTDQSNSVFTITNAG